MSRTTSRLAVLGLAPLLALGLAQPAQAISGGAPVADGAEAHTVKLDIGGGARACTAVLITPDWLLSAATCFAQAGEGHAIPGGAPRQPVATSIGGQARTVTHLVPRPDRNLALAKLSGPVTGVTPAPLATAAPAVGATVRALGHGRTGTEWVPQRAHGAEFTVRAVTPSTVDIDSAAAGVCRGDSGGPTFAGPALVGIHASSWQNGCLGETGTRTGAVDSRVDDIRDWILGQALDPKATALRKHAISLSWTALPGVTGYRVHGARAANVPLTEATLLGTATGTSFVQGNLPAKQSWHYRIVPVGAAAQASPEVSASVRVSTGTDFTGDGKDDIATFLRGDNGDVHVGRSEGNRFTAAKWHEYFAPFGETPLSGDFDGDGRADIVTFVKGGEGKVYVSLSDGTKFIQDNKLWHPGFGYGTDIPYTGDFNGDGKDDIAVFTRGDSGHVWVSLSDGTKFLPATRWHDRFAPGAEFPAVGDFNGDGKDDIVTFTRGGQGLVYVSLSDGGKFIQDNKIWHHGFSYGGDIPAVGDFNGDGRDDIATFTRGDSGHVWISPNMGGSFGGASRWHDRFAPGVEKPGVGDFDGDGKADIVTFVGGGEPKVYVSRSTGSGFIADNAVWHEFFAPDPEVPLPSRVF